MGEGSIDSSRPIEAYISPVINVKIFLRVIVVVTLWINRSEQNHTRLAAIENINTIDERRSKITRKRVSIAICRLTGGKWQSKTLYLVIFDSRSSIVNSVFDCRLLGMRTQPL